MLSQVRNALLRAGDRALDRRLGFETAGVVTYDALEFDDQRSDKHYQVTNWVALWWAHHVLRRFAPTAEESFVDFGSGKGRVVALAARFPFGRVVGVELSRALARESRDNLRGTRVEIVEGDIATYPIPDDLAVAFFFNPSQGEAFTAAADAIRASLDRRPRRFLLLYVNPAMHDHLLERGFRVARRARVVNARAYAYAPARR